MEWKSFIIVFLIYIIYPNEAAKHANCDFEAMPGINATISGHVSLNQLGPERPLYVTISGIHGLKAGKHGFHIHENGDCTDPGPHYNPQMLKHGFIEEPDRDYHVGDLGNLIVFDIPFETEIIYVPGDIAGIFPESDHMIVGRSFVLHELEDDLGMGGDEGSEATGNAGTKLGCCVIKVK